MHFTVAIKDDEKLVLINDHEILSMTSDSRSNALLGTTYTKKVFSVVILAVFKKIKLP